MDSSDQTAQQHQQQQQQSTMTTSPSAPAYQASTMASHIPTSLRITQMNAAPMLPPGLPQPYSSMQGSAMTTAQSTRSSASEGANTTGSVHTGTHTPFEQLAHSSSGEVGPASGGTGGIMTSHGGSPMGDLGQRLGWLHHHTTTSPEDERGGVNPFRFSAAGGETQQQQQQGYYPQEGAGQYQQ